MSSTTECSSRIDMERVCRTCLAEDEELRSVFVAIEPPGGTSLTTMVAYCTQLEFIEGDGLPIHICCKCLENVTKAFTFKLQAEKADAHLREYIAKKHVNASSLIIKRVSSIKQESCSKIDPDLVIKTEIKQNDEYESNYDDDYDMPMGMDGSDDSEDDFKPLKDLQIIKHSSDPELAKKTPRKFVPCELCNKTFLNSISLENHKEKCHPGFAQCDICLRTFTKNSYLERHKIASHSMHINTASEKNDKLEFNSPITCTLCNFTFSREDQLISHITLSHNGPRKRGRPSKKDILMNKIKIRKILETMNIKTESDEFDLTEHPVEFFDSIPESPVDIQAKVEMYPESNDFVDNYCSLCCKTFTSNISFDKHNKKHLVHKPSYCKICDKTFKYVNALKDHLQTHCLADSFTGIDLKSKIHLFEFHEKMSEIALDTVSEEFIQNIITEDIKAKNCDIYIGEMKVDTENQIVSDTNDSDSDLNDEIMNKKLSIYINKAKLKRGALKLRKYKIHKCSLCNQSFSRSNHIMRHMSTHNYNYPDKCEICDKVFPNKEMLVRHKQMQCENTTKNYQCSTCRLKFTYKMSLNKHILKHHKGEPISVSSKSSNSGASKKDKIHECPNCNKGFHRKDHLDKHVKVHLPNEKKYHCANCSKSFYRKDHLDKHVKVHLPSEKKFECPICQKKFSRKDNLRSHSRIHEPNKEELDSNCLCVYCGKSFSNSSNLIVHMRRHTGEKPYKCDICGKGFPRSSDLQCHRRTHTGEKPCLCTICGKGFSRSNKLVRHMRIHTGQRPYKCTFCERAFTQSNDLTLHVRRHTGDKPYVCGVCGDRFIQGTALQAHRRSHGHYEPNLASTIPSNSVNSPNRMLNRVATVGNTAKSESTTSAPATSEASETVNASSTSSGTSRPSTVAARAHNMMANNVSSIFANPTLLFQNMSEVPNAITTIPLLSLHYNQGYN